jgi:capsular exopolysaccharide synthesis family protein
LANSGNKVLLVDANLKYPVLYKFFKVKSTPSIAHYLFRKKELDEIIRNTHNKNLDLITCIEFPQNPAVILNSERMKNFVDTVKNKYDYVIYDSSSLNALAETVHLAALMDEVILVARAGKTRLSELLSLQTTLSDNGLFDCEIILNDVKMKK